MPNYVNINFCVFVNAYAAMDMMSCRVDVGFATLKSVMHMQPMQ